MAKRNDDSTSDYIEQLQWQARHRRRFWPVRYEPKWKYRIVYRNPPGSTVERAVQIAIWVILILSVVYLLVSDRLTEQAGAKVFLGLVFGLIATILFFAVRDASGENEDDS